VNDTEARVIDRPSGDGGVPTVRVGVIGLGNVGAALVRLLDDTAEDIAERAGFRLEVTRAVVRHPSQPRDVPLDPDRIGTDPAALVADPGVDVVCELIGGVDPAKAIVLDALGRGKPVVTANKELLATMGRDLFDMAEERGVDLAFEGAVGGGIPLVRALKESLAGERITRVVGIVNGTTNLILTRRSRRPWRRPSASATRRPTPPPTSRATTPRPSAPSSRRSRSTPGWSRPTCSGRASAA
jgi:homoserine dehydrogenase